MDLLDVGVCEIAKRIRSREVSAVEVVDAHIARIEAVNPAINAMIATRFDAARTEAVAADQRIGSEAPDDLPDLIGVPCSVKEFVGVQGMPHTAGLSRQRNKVATEDATAVARLRAAGCIVLGMGNVPDGGIWMETYNPIYGWTNNPWDSARTPGGSSGGEAAIVSAGGVPFGLGADIGGSIRIPSACCGTVGHKPTGGTIPNTGVHAPSGALCGRYHTVGPIARRVADLMPLVKIMAGPDGRCPSTDARLLGDPSTVRIEDLVVHVADGNGRAWVSSDVKAGVWRAAKALEERGAQIRPLRSPHLTAAFEIWAAMLADGNDESYAEVLACGQPFSYPAELAKMLMRRGDISSPALVIGMLADLLDKLPGQQDALVQQGLTARAELEQIMGDDGVLLTPTFPVTAPVHRELLLRPFAATFVQLFNVLEFPATVVPSGFDHRGLPTSVQLVGRRGDDHRTIAAAAAVEDGLGGWTRIDPRPGRLRDAIKQRLWGTS